MINEAFLSLLNFFAQNLGDSYGLAIIFVTLLIRVCLLPIILPSLKSHRKLLSLKGETDELKKKYGHDKKLLSEKQMEFYKKNNVNPLGGCLPQLIQLGLFITFYHVLINSLSSTSNLFSLQFFWLDLSKPDGTYILPVLTAVTQFVLGVMLLPATSTKAELKLASSTKSKKDDKEAVDATEMAQTMQSQMIVIMPFITGFIALRFPAGLAVYWVTTTVFSIVQQYFVSGLGGLKPYISRIQKLIKV